MQHENSFSVSRFKNRNGAFSFRVDGYLNGNRIRRNFKTREEAAAEQAALTIKALQLASNLRSVSTSLTEDQVREAEVAFRRITERGRPLSFYVDFTLTNFREPASRKLIAEAVTEFEVPEPRDQILQDHGAIRFVIQKHPAGIHALTQCERFTRSLGHPEQPWLNRLWRFADDFQSQ